MLQSAKKTIFILSLTILISTVIPSTASAGGAKIILNIAKVLLKGVAGEFLDRQVYSKMVEGLISHTENNRKQISRLELPSSEKKQYLDINKSIMLSLEDLQHKITDQNITDQQLKTEIKNITINQIQPLANKMDKIESRLAKVESKIKEHDQAILSCEKNLEIACTKFNNTRRDLKSIEIELNDLYLESEQKWEIITKEIQNLHQEDVRINKNYERLSTRVDNLILTNFSLFHTSLKFQSKYWNDLINPDFPPNGNNFHFEGIGGGISLQIEKRVRLMGDVYYINPDLNISNMIDETKNNYKLSGLQVKGYGLSGLAHLTFFSKNGFGIEGGGGYQWSEYIMETDQAYQKINEKGIILSGGVTLMKEHYSVWVILQGMRHKKGFIFSHLKVGLSYIL